VLFTPTIPQNLKLLLTEIIHEDVEIFVDLMKSFSNMSFLLPLDPVNPFAPENIPF
jgi:hypothetical protein